MVSSIREVLMVLVAGIVATTSSMKISGHPTFPLAIRAKASDLEKSRFVQLRYQRANGKGVVLATPWEEVTAETVDLQAMRVAGGTLYKFELFSASDAFGTDARLHASSEFVTNEAPLPFDTVGFGTITGSPTFDFLMIDVNYASGGFDGWVAVDTEGDVVWYANTTTNFGVDSGNFPTHAIDQLPSGNFVFQSMIASAPLMEISPTGELVHHLADPHTCGIVTHEARYDSTSDSSNPTVLSTKETVRNVEGLVLPQTGNDIIAWDRENGTYEVLFSTFDYLDPVTDRGYLSDNGMNPYNDECNGTDTSLSDWTHLNSVSVGAFDNYLISVRHLSAIMSISRTTFKLLWTLSSEIDSDFTFASEASKFYDQHAVLQAENGDLMLFDNGNARTQYQGGSDFSRGLILSMDYENKVASLKTEFVGAYTDHEGSTYQLDSGNYVTCFPAGDGGDLNGWLPGGHAEGSASTTKVYEYDIDGSEVSSLETPYFDDTPYRATPFSTIGGETALHA